MGHVVLGQPHALPHHGLHDGARGGGGEGAGPELVLQGEHQEGEGGAELEFPLAGPPHELAHLSQHVAGLGGDRVEELVLVAAGEGVEAGGRGRGGGVGGVGRGEEGEGGRRGSGRRGRR